MKFQIQVKEQDSQPWWESYDRHEVTTKEEALAYGKQTVEYFNSTLRPGERAREVLDARIVGEGEVGRSHKWRKQNLYTLADHHGNFDKVKCELCEVTARRYGISHIVRQTPYRAKKYQYCQGKPR